MNATRRSQWALTVLASCALVAGCEMDAQPEYMYDEAIADLSFTGLSVYDSGTRCNMIGGGQMHCCPNGTAMIGAHLDNDVFRCAQLTGVAGSRIENTHTNRTLRNGMHACPVGLVMVGLHVGRDSLLCQRPNPGVTFEYVDGNPGTLDGYPMHVCQDGFAMSGIHVDNNRFTCAF